MPEARVRRRSPHRALAPLLAAAWVACSVEPPELASCETHGGITPVCAFRNPEDLAHVPGTPWILVSEFPPPGEAGALVAYRQVDGLLRRLHPAGPDEGRLSSPEPAPGWGDPACPGPPDPARFAPHGIDLREERLFAATVAVVNHGGREAVELFELAYAAGGPALGWRGCVPLPDGAWGNDVALMGDGGFVVSEMMKAPEGVAGLVSGLALAVGADSGRVWRWTPEVGLRPVAGSEASGPNGVAVSADNSQLFVAEWGRQRLLRVGLGAEPQRREIDVPLRPDNLSWARDGRLLVAGQQARLGETMACLRRTRSEGVCGLRWAVVAVDPVSLEQETLIESEARATGAVSSAVHVGGELLLGTFAGDRIARMRFPH